MSKVMDITEKLNFVEKPKLKIGSETLSVNNSAVTVLKIMGIVKGTMTPDKIEEVYSLLFAPEEQEKLESLNLDFNDFTTVLTNAISLVSGSETEGEAVTPATT